VSVCTQIIKYFSSQRADVNELERSLDSFLQSIGGPTANPFAAVDPGRRFAMPPQALKAETSPPPFSSVGPSRNTTYTPAGVGLDYSKNNTVPTSPEYDVDIQLPTPRNDEYEEDEDFFNQDAFQPIQTTPIKMQPAVVDLSQYLDISRCQAINDLSPSPFEAFLGGSERLVSGKGIGKLSLFYAMSQSVAVSFREKLYIAISNLLHTK